MGRPRGPLVLALVPPAAMAFVIRVASLEDTYAGDGRSSWQTHPAGRAAVIFAAVVSVGTLVTIFIVRGGGRVEWTIAIVATLISLFAVGIALVALSAN